MIIHDPTRLVEVVSFIQTENEGSSKSGWFLDFFSTKKRTKAEKLELRKYTKTKSKPLLYVGACLPPKMISANEESVNVDEFTFPTIKAETKITGCDIDERRILPDGTVIPVGIQRFNEALNWGMKSVTEGLRERHILEAINVMKEGGYVLNSSDTEDMGTVDFGRKASLKDIDLSGTASSWDNMCSKPLDTLEAVLQEMSREKAVAGVIDIIYSPYAWSWMEAHDERQAVKYDTKPKLDNGFDATPFLEYDDIQFKGATNGGKYRHWVDFSKHQDHTGAEVDTLEAGEIMIVSKQGLNLQRVFRTITSDNREELPAGADFFLYDDLEEEYNRKCRSFSPWIEEYHLMVPANVNGAVVMRVVAADAGVPCTNCETCP